MPQFSEREHSSGFLLAYAGVLGRFRKDLEQSGLEVMSPRFYCHGILKHWVCVADKGTSSVPDRTEVLLHMTRSKISDSMGALMSKIQVPPNLGPSQAVISSICIWRSIVWQAEVLKMALIYAGILAVLFQILSSCKSLIKAQFLSSNTPVSSCSFKKTHTQNL